MKIELKKATRKQVKLRMGLSGTSGSGKTYSALLLAFGITGDWNKIAVIDTENGSASLYSHLGGFNTIDLQAPFSPERYIDAIKACEAANIEVCIIDSITHEWDGAGGCLEICEQITQASASKNSYTAWAKVTPRHNDFVNAILQSKMHMITCVRRKQDYEMSKNANGKTVVEKAGLKEVTREGFEYELTLNLAIDSGHMITASKDRTGLFMDKPSFVVTTETGKKILDWCQSGVDGLSEARLKYFLLVQESKHVFNDVECEKFLNGYKEWEESKLQKAYDKVKALVKEREDMLESEATEKAARA